MFPLVTKLEAAGVFFDVYDFVYLVISFMASFSTPLPLCYLKSFVVWFKSDSKSSIFDCILTFGYNWIEIGLLSSASAFTKGLYVARSLLSLNYVEFSVCLLSTI